MIGGGVSRAGEQLLGAGARARARRRRSAGRAAGRDRAVGARRRGRRRRRGSGRVRAARRRSRVADALTRSPSTARSSRGLESLLPSVDAVAQRLIARLRARRARATRSATAAARRTRSTSPASSSGASCASAVRCRRVALGRPVRRHVHRERLLVRRRLRAPGAGAGRARGRRRRRLHDERTLRRTSSRGLRAGARGWARRRAVRRRLRQPAAEHADHALVVPSTRRRACRSCTCCSAPVIDQVDAWAARDERAHLRT